MKYPWSFEEDEFWIPDMYRNVLVKGDICCGVFVFHGLVKQMLFEFIRNI